MFDRRYGPLDSRPHSPGSPAALAMEANKRARGGQIRMPTMQPRQSGPLGAPSSAAPALTPDQIATLIEDGRQASYGVTNKRMEIEALLREREREQQWRGPEPYLMSNEAQRAEESARSYFGSATDNTLRKVDENLRAVERDLRLPNASASGVHPYRSFGPRELAEQKRVGFEFAGAYDPEKPSAIGINYPLYARAHPASYPLETQVHEWLHLLGKKPLPNRAELYGEKAVRAAAERGGANWAVNNNPENTAMYVFRPGPFTYGVPSFKFD